jgi:hypothetical protein
MITLLDCTFSFFANFPSRDLTTYDAFQSLFGERKCPTIPPNPENKGNSLYFNPMDMFILIHRKYDSASYYCIFLILIVLYVHVHKHITLCLGGTTTIPETGIGTSYTPISDSNLILIKSALSRWHTLWTIIRSKIESYQWAQLGYFRNGYNYWLVIQLLVNNNGSIDIMMGMEVGCEDTLKQLKELLRESGGEV